MNRRRVDAEEVTKDDFLSMDKQTLEYVIDLIEKLGPNEGYEEYYEEN